MYTKFKHLSLIFFLILPFICAKCLYDDTLNPAQLELDQTTLDLQRDDTTINLTLENTGQQGLNWTLNTDLAWFKNASPSSGELKCFHKTQIQVTIDRSKLSKAGQNQGQVTLTAIPQSSGTVKGSPQVINLKAFRVAKPKLKMLNTEITKISTTTATAQALIEEVGSSDIIQHGHVWSTNPNPTLTTANSLKSELGTRTDKGNFETVLTNLSRNTTYYIRAYATNTEGTGYSQSVTFKTLENPPNHPPTNIRLSNTGIAEKNPINAVIGTLSTTDADASDRHVYTLVSGGANFNINGNELRASQVFDRATQNSYTIRIKTDDSNGGTFERDFNIIILKVNNPPTAIQLSNTSIAENNAVNAVIGTLSTTDADAGDTHTYTLVLGSSDFNIIDDSLRASQVYDYESRNSYTIRIKTDDGNGGTLEQDFTIRIRDVTEPFITTWQTRSVNESITIPTTGGGYNYRIDWGDGTIETGKTGDASHVYAVAGTYTVQISGDFPRIYFNNPRPSILNRNSTKIISIDQWGEIAWESMAKAFTGCINLAGQAIDNPDLSRVTNLDSMFFQDQKFNQVIGSWDVSNITSMAWMFTNALAFNQPIGSWKVDNVTNMNAMFANAFAFNQPIGSWKVHNVTNMESMFASAFAFNQPIGSWKVHNVTNMESMFRGASAFNQPIGSWEVDNVTDMNAMFMDTPFNQDISNWEVSKVTNMNRMFRHQSNVHPFNQTIGSWKVHNVTDMGFMFAGAPDFNQDVKSWNVSKVTDMSAMFQGARTFNQNISSWNVSKVTDMSVMFQDARAFNQNISSWSVNKVTFCNNFSSGSSLSNSNKPRFTMCRE